METKQKALTKTQINHFAEKLRVVQRRVSADVEEQCTKTFPKEMTNREKLEQIASGKAELKFDHLMNKVADGWGLGNLVEAYDFPGACEKDMLRKNEKQRLRKFLKVILNDRERIIDEFVLGRVFEPDVAVAEFETRTAMYVKRFLDEKPY